MRIEISEMRYKPFGEIRFTWKSSDPALIPSAYTLTRQTFTDQYSYADDPSTAGVEGFGLMFYQSRFYDPSLGRFTSADSIVPAGVQGYDRYAYVNNSPVNFTDPTGHTTSCSTGDCGADGSTRSEPEPGVTIDDSVDGSIGDTPTITDIVTPGMSFLASEATGFDVAAFLANLAFAVPADVIMLVYPPSIPVVEGAYQPYSVLPNALSSVATVLWALEGVRTGQTTVSINLESSGTGDFSTTNIINGAKISFSLDQDTAISATTNAAGILVLKEVNAALIVDGGVVFYDVGRNTKVIPAVNPTVSYYTSSGGWDFSLFPK